MRGHDDIRERRWPAWRREKIPAAARIECRRGDGDNVAVVDDARPSRSGRLVTAVAELEVAESKPKSPGRRPLDPTLAVVADSLCRVIQLAKRVVDRAKGNAELETDGLHGATKRV